MEIFSLNQKHKVMEAPEIIWINPTTDLPRLNGHINKKSIKYVKADAFINKAATWFADRYQANGSYLSADDIEEFIKTMKGE